MPLTHDKHAAPLTLLWIDEFDQNGRV